MSEVEPNDDLMERFKLDRTIASVGFAQDSDAERRAYWHSPTPEERLLYVEHLRRMNHGTGQATQRPKEFLKLLNQASIEYLVIAGYAVGFHGHPRATNDIDVWVSANCANIEKLVEVLRFWRKLRQCVFRPVACDF